MRRSPSTEDESRRSDRGTTLPHIRDLFGPELSQSLRAPPIPGNFTYSPSHSPSSSLSRLRLPPDDEDLPPLGDPYSYSVGTSTRRGSQSREYSQYIDRPPPGQYGSPLTSASTATSQSLATPPSFVSSFPPGRPSSLSTDPSSSRSLYFSDHLRSKSLSDAQGRTSYAPFPDPRYHPSSPGSTLLSSPAADWRHRPCPTQEIALASQSQSYSHGQHSYDRSAPRTIDPIPAGPIGRNRSGSEATGMERVTSSGKYECQYCGKGFNRPSSLKIHINSHTGEKPFRCPHEGCGRTFSVLSNMRRHARVHNQSQLRQRESSSEEVEASDGGQSVSGSPSYSPPMPLRSSSSASAVGVPAAPGGAYNHSGAGSQSAARSGLGRRRESSISSSVAGSHSHSSSSEGEDTQGRLGRGRGRR